MEKNTNVFKTKTKTKKNLHIHWNAWTRLQWSRTRVRFGRSRRRGRDTADRASMPRQAASCHMDSPTRTDAAQIGPYRPNIGVFQPEKGNRLVRRKKNLKLKILVDLIRSLHRLNPFLLLLLLFCFFVFFFLFFRSVVVLFCCRFRPIFKDFSRPYRSVTHYSSSSSSPALTPFFFFFFFFAS